MKITIHRIPEVVALVERDKVDAFIQKNIESGEYFTLGNMYPDGWYEKEYRKAETRP